MMTWVMMMMKRYSFPIRWMVEECGAGPVQEAGHESRPLQIVAAHKWMKRIPAGLLDSLLRFTGGDARRTLSVDSTRYTFNRYVLVEDAKRGKFYRVVTVKHHALITDGCGMLSLWMFLCGPPSRVSIRYIAVSIGCAYRPTYYAARGIMRKIRDLPEGVLPGTGKTDEGHARAGPKGCRWQATARNAPSPAGVASRAARAGAPSRRTFRWSPSATCAPPPTNPT